jgi:hypothetical protein
VQHDCKRQRVVQRQFPARCFTRKTGWISTPFGATPSWTVNLLEEERPNHGVLDWAREVLES